MPTRLVVVAVRVEILSHDHGHWCRRCQLPSGVRAHVAMTAGDRMQPRHRAVLSSHGPRSVVVRVIGVDGGKCAEGRAGPGLAVMLGAHLNAMSAHA